jgi:large subunit ribosomal protein L9
VAAAGATAAIAATAATAGSAEVEVILLSDVEHVGLRGDVVSVARGYARNFLLPRRLAEEATAARVAELQKREAHRARHEAKSAEQANEIAQILSNTVLRFEVKAGPTGSLFGSVTPTNIADELWNTKKVRIDRRKIETDPIKRIGRYEIPVALFEDVRAEVQTEVIPEGGELPSDEELEKMEAVERAEQEEAAAAAEPSGELEEILAEVDAAEAAEVEEAAGERAEADEPETADAAEAEETAEAEPQWRADADAALAEE